jgi:5-methylcytosine-specific restriction endonuclease McrA
VIKLADIVEIRRSEQGRGYDIIFSDGRAIWVTKARAIIALLILVQYGEGSESDLAKGSERIPEIRNILKDKYPEELIRDYYGDANKPFSELWNEEGFVWIKQPSGQRMNRSQRYVLLPEDHEKFFLSVRKAFRQAPSVKTLPSVKQRLPGRCNICGAKVMSDKEIVTNAFSRDRLRRRIDHRIPVEKGGSSEDPGNFQLLCFYCNKSKWQICNICSDPKCEECALAFPEGSTRVFPTGEDIKDRMMFLLE